MPLVDAYIKCGEIKGGLEAPQKAGGSTRHEVSHDGWSEIYSFKYEISDKYPTISITKPVDLASNDLYLLFLKNRSRELQKGKKTPDDVIEEITIDLCRWVDVNNDGIVDEFIVFLKYIIKNCRVTSYSTSMDFEADDIPEETVAFGFQEMHMCYYRPKDPSRFGWDFMKAELMPCAIN